MKRIICSMVGLCLLAGAGAAFAQTPSLADIARKEQARRKTQKHPTKVYTNADVPMTVAATSSTATEVSTTPKEGTPADGSEEARSAAAAAAAGNASATGAAGASGSTQASPGQTGVKPGVSAGDEAQWRAKMSAAREQVSRAQLQLEAMRTRVLNLQSARAVGSTEASTQNRLQRQQQEALQEFDKLRADVEKHQKALMDLESQARAASVPAGWLR